MKTMAFKRVATPVVTPQANKNNGLAESLGNIGALKSKGLFERVPNHRRLFVQNSPALQSQTFAPDLGRIRSHLVATGTNQLWSTLERV